MAATKMIAIASLIYTTVIGLALVAAGSPVRAQGYPERPITLLIPYTAGGPTDISSRVAAESVSRVLGKRMTVDNRPGAGGALAAS
ncbi:MAG TPA: tripartite tricarboxylate transporter substrate binding protein, partial [Burkholderiales bacterium]|nr:tripartite tricarboxylate transporter substrate binding protein [Burkholderiales bacterium]